jgi:hypothetical protein
MFFIACHSQTRQRKPDDVSGTLISCRGKSLVSLRFVFVQRGVDFLGPAYRRPADTGTGYLDIEFVPEEQGRLVSVHMGVFGHTMHSTWEV